MNTQDAYNVLGLPEGALATAVQEKYNELYNDYQIRLTNAPTPNLKKLYQKNIEELNEAMTALNIGQQPANNNELPVSGPVFNATAQTKRQTEYIPQGKGPSIANRPQPQVAKEHNNNLLFIIGFVALVGIAAAAFFGIKASETDKKLVDFAALKAQNDSLLNYKNKFSNAKFVIENNGTAPFTIKAVIIEYLGHNGELVRYFDQQYNIEIQPGANAKLSRVKGDKQEWDGSVISYCCIIIYKNEPVIRAGLWSHQAQKEDGMLHLNMDINE